ncbi:MAG: hypothetical protein K0B01_12705, partial [Syntrophobacterales bacterium]|nr:hypothetical protein [Syntrophobacterales bacterium]
SAAMLRSSLNGVSIGVITPVVLFFFILPASSLVFHHVVCQLSLPSVPCAMGRLSSSLTFGQSSFEDCHMVTISVKSKRALSTMNLFSA